MAQEPGSNRRGLHQLAEQSNLTNGQLLIWLGQEMNPGRPLYNMAMRFDIAGPVDVVNFQRAFQDVVDGSDAMRSVIEVVDGVPQQRVAGSVEFDLEVLDLSRDVEAEAHCREEVERRTARQIDLARCNFDTVLIRLESRRYVWYFNQHHLFTDIGSIELIFSHVSRCYLAYQSSGAPRSPGQTAHLPQFAVYRESEQRARQSAEGGGPESGNSQVSLYHRETRSRQTPAFRVERILSPTQSEKLKRLAQAPGYAMLGRDLPIFNILVTAFSAYLFRISDQEQFSIGCPVSKRGTLALRNTIGLFIEMFPLEVVVEPGDTFATLHGRIARASLEHLRLASSSRSLVESVRGNNVVVNYITAKFADFASIPCDTTWLHNNHIDPQHDLRFQIMDLAGSGELKLCFDINCELMDADRGHRALSHFLNVLDGMLNDPDKRVEEVGLAAPSEAADLISQLSRTSGELVPTVGNGESDTFLSRFRQVATDSPGAVAATHGSEQVTYAELDRLSDGLAATVLQRLERPGLLGICAARSFELLVAILSAMKAGAAFVPLDPAYPDKRIRDICGTANPDLVLADGPQKDRMCGLHECVLEISPAESRIEESGDPPLPAVSPEGDAYVIFTSGSTGTPKGVAVQHGPLLNYVEWAVEQYLDDRPGHSVAVFPLYSSIGFDLTITSIFVPLSSGGSIRIYPQHHDAMDLSIFDVIQEDAVDVIKLTPAHLTLLTGMNLSNSRAHTLILGGEDLTTAVAEQARRVFRPGVRVFNEYGPTEAVVGCMVHEYDPEEDRAVSVPIGLPADGVNIYLLDAGGNPVPKEVTGEIHIGGSRLSRGYLNRPDLTAERFLPDPYCPAGKMYQTGDLARMNPDGRLTYLGREDAQVKIRGVRIETAEIVDAMKSHPGVEGCHIATLQPSLVTGDEPLRYCTDCGLASNYPGVHYDDAGKCNHCRDFESYRDRAAGYFRSMPELRGLLGKLAAAKRGRFDVMMLLSGGKDSTYALYQVCAMGLRVFAMTLDNGYISDGAKANIRRSISDLGIEHEFVTSPGMNEIFADSLNRHSSVCYGCFKAIYTLAINIAHQRGIPVILTGLSRGQMFETRLTRQVFERSGFDPDQIDREVLEARKVYHRIPDKVTECLDMTLFETDEIFDEITFVDFYRYCDVSMEEMYAFLEHHAPWTRPEDTGRSTNCLINDTGIYVHKNKLGYHNYALPYSWDVRLGHKQRESALEELNDRIDASRVHEILREIDFQDAGYLENDSQKKLVAYYSGSATLNNDELRTFLLARLPEAMVPAYFVHLENIPLSVNGKIDRDALPDPRNERPNLSQAISPATSGEERELVTIWKETLRINQVGIDDNFFDLGGDSIVAIQIVIRASERGISITPNQLFFHQTIRQLAKVVGRDSPRDAESKDDEMEPFSLVDQDAAVLRNLSSLLDN